jgi:hypothetical protein
LTEISNGGPAAPAHEADASAMTAAVIMMNR